MLVRGGASTGGTAGVPQWLPAMERGARCPLGLWLLLLLLPPAHGRQESGGPGRAGGPSGAGAGAGRRRSPASWLRCGRDSRRAGHRAQGRRDVRVGREGGWGRRVGVWRCLCCSGSWRVSGSSGFRVTVGRRGNSSGHPWQASPALGSSAPRRNTLGVKSRARGVSLCGVCFLRPLPEEMKGGFLSVAFNLSSL